MGGPTGKPGAAVRAVRGALTLASAQRSEQRGTDGLLPVLGEEINVGVVWGGVGVPLGGVGEWVAQQASLALPSGVLEGL